MSKLNLNPMADWGYVNNSRFRFLSIRNQGGGVEPVPPEPPVPPTPTIKGWYGVEVDESNTDPAGAVTRIASDMTLHASLPIQSGMRRCVIGAEGKVGYYLDAADSTLKSDGTPAVLDGTDGDVMVEIPEHWVLVTKEDSTLTVKLATEEGILEGAQRVPLHYISAYQATADEDGVLKSISGAGAIGNMNIGQFRALATAKNINGVTGWSQYLYDDAVDLYWLFLVEYKNRNSQDNINNSLTAEGYHQGGLGMGCTYVDGIQNWPAVYNGITNLLGNSSGEVKDDSIKTAVNSYRGIENPFGNIYTFYDGIVNLYGQIYRCANAADCRSFFMEGDISSSTVRAYVKGEIAVANEKDEYHLFECIADAAQGTNIENTTYFSLTTMATLGYTLDATYAEDVSGCLFTINSGASALGSILAETAGGKSFDTNYCDASDVLADSLCCVCGGGCAYGYAENAAFYGLACVSAVGGGFGYAGANCGSRLCYTGGE